MSSYGNTINYDIVFIGGYLHESNSCPTSTARTICLLLKSYKGLANKIIILYLGKIIVNMFECK